MIEPSKEAYYLALRQTQGTIRMEAPNWQPWLVFFLRSLAEQVRRLTKKIGREKIVLATMPELSLQIGEAIKLTGASRNTLKQYFRALVERGTLNQYGSGREGMVRPALMSLRTRVRFLKRNLTGRAVLNVEVPSLATGRRGKPLEHPQLSACPNPLFAGIHRVPQLTRTPVSRTFNAVWHRLPSHHHTTPIPTLTGWDFFCAKGH